MNRVTHFEIPCNEPEKTIAFFETVFGWKFQRFGGEDYWLAGTGNEKEPGINGAVMKKKHPQQPVANSIRVEDINASMQAVTAAGGKIVVPKMVIPTVGYLSYFTDPDGNIHGLWQQDAGAR